VAGSACSEGVPEVMISQVAVQDAILAEVQTIQGLDVYEGPYTNAEQPVEQSNGLFIPYCTVQFGTSYEGSERGIGPVEYNSLLTNTTVYVVAPNDRLSREFQDQVRVKLTGFIPADSTPLTIQGGFNFADTDLGPTRYVHGTTFRHQTNMQF